MVITEEEFKSKFKNRNLEPYASQLYKSVYTINWLKQVAEQKSAFEQKLASYLTEAVDILYMIEEMLSGNFRHNKRVISDAKILGMLIGDLEMAYRMKIEFYRKYLDETEFNVSSIGEYPVVFMAYDENGNEVHSNNAYMYGSDDQYYSGLIPDPPFNERIFTVERPEVIKEYIAAIESVRAYALSKSRFDMELPVKAFLKDVVRMNIPLSNRVYLELYECLVLADSIDSETIHSHEVSREPYCRENFIKLRFKRVIKEMQNPRDHVEITFTLHLDEEHPENNIKGF